MLAAPQAEREDPAGLVQKLPSCPPESRVTARIVGRDRNEIANAPLDRSSARYGSIPESCGDGALEERCWPPHEKRVNENLKGLNSAALVDRTGPSAQKRDLSVAACFIERIERCFDKRHRQPPSVDLAASKRHENASREVEAK